MIEKLDIDVLAAAIVLRGTAMGLANYRITETFSPQMELAIDNEIRAATGARFDAPLPVGSLKPMYSYGDLRAAVDRMRQKGM